MYMIKLYQVNFIIKSNMERMIERQIDWEKIHTRSGDTQNSERYYIGVIKEVIQTMGATIGSQAGSQQSVDIRDVQWPDGETKSYECKKVNKGFRFIFNDTFIKPDVYYIFIYVDLRKVQILKGSDIINKTTELESNEPKKHIKILARIILHMLDTKPTPENVKSLFIETLHFLKSCVLHGIITYFEFGELFKTTISFGNFVSRPRPNWSLIVPYKPQQSLEEGLRSLTV
jgi:hypothetical protein